MGSLGVFALPDQPPWGFRSEVKQDQDWHGPDPLECPWETIGPFGSSGDRVALNDRRHDEVAQDLALGIMSRRGGEETARTRLM